MPRPPQPPPAPPVSRAQWGSRIGLILAMAGNAVGLGNFLRFPKQAVENGGGTFMIPYFIALIVLGIPLVWIEWGLGRHGGLHGHGSSPGMFASLWRHPIAKYLGVIGLFVPLLVLIYYTYIESWTLAWAWFSASGALRGLDEAGMRHFLASYQDLADPSVHATWVPVFFFLFTLALNFAVLARGVTSGIEKLARIGMPLLFLFAALLVIRVLTLGPHEITVPGSPPTTSSPWVGLDFMFTPDWTALGSARVWLAAAGQIFFTLSVGMGTLPAYASYLRKKDDIPLSGLAMAATNETAEVVLGGSLAIPAVVTFFGVSGAIAIAQGGGFDLGFVAMPLVFDRLPGGPVVASLAGVMWFGLLFIAGITSSVAMATPCMSFMQERFGWTRRKAALSLGALVTLVGLAHIVWYSRGFLDEWDYWGGTFGLVLLGLVETVVFVWVFGPNRAWNELHQGAAISIPRFFKPILTVLTPLYLIVVLAWWTVQEAIPVLLLQGRPEGELGTRWASRLVMVALFAGLVLLTRAAWKRTERGAP